MSIFLYLFIKIILPFIATIAIECALVYIIFKNKGLTYCIFLCNVITNPTLNFLLMIFDNLYLYNLSLARHIILIILEFIAVFIEAYIISYMINFNKKKSILISLLLNTCSFLAGIILFKSF